VNLKYHDIKKEIKDLGLNNKKVADLLGISVQGLDYRIKQDLPTIHWAMYGISNYYGEPDNLVINEKV
jgi:cyanate lyase